MNSSVAFIHGIKHEVRQNLEIMMAASSKTPLIPPHLQT